MVETHPFDLLGMDNSSLVFVDRNPSRPIIKQDSRTGLSLAEAFPEDSPTIAAMERLVYPVRAGEQEMREILEAQQELKVEFGGVAFGFFLKNTALAGYVLTYPAISTQHEDPILWLDDVTILKGSRSINAAILAFDHALQIASNLGRPIEGLSREQSTQRLLKSQFGARLLRQYNYRVVEDTAQENLWQGDGYNESFHSIRVEPISMPTAKPEIVAA